MHRSTSHNSRPHSPCRSETTESPLFPSDTPPAQQAANLDPTLSALSRAPERLSSRTETSVRSSSAQRQAIQNTASQLEAKMRRQQSTVPPQLQLDEALRCNSEPQDLQLLSAAIGINEQLQKLEKALRTDNSTEPYDHFADWFQTPDDGVLRHEQLEQHFQGLQAALETNDPTEPEDHSSGW
jgi:hypothetical protein